MLDFLRTDGLWLLLGMFFLFMVLMARLRGESSGTGCCGGYHGRPGKREQDGHEHAEQEEDYVSGDASRANRPGACH